MTMTGCTAGDMLLVQLTRDNTVGSNLADAFNYVTGSVRFQ